MKMILTFIFAAFATSATAHEAVQTKKVEKLGFQKMDKIETINGEQVDSPQKAMELYNTMKLEGDTATVGRAPQARCVPNVMPNSGGQINGFKCLQVPAGGGFAKAGVRDGDIVVYVDGETLRTAPEALNLLKRVEENKHAQLHVIRDGREEVLSRR